MASITYIGSQLSLVQAAPTTKNPASYAALSFVEIGKVISMGEIGDTSEDVTVDLLKTGRRQHINGVADIGDIEIMCEHSVANSDNQQVIRAAQNSNSVYSFDVEDPDGEHFYFEGVIANYRETERSASSFKGAMFTIRGQSAIIHQGVPGIQVQRKEYTVPEGATGGNRTDMYYRLTAQPSGNVTITITGQADSDLTVDSGTKVFDTSDWDTWKRTRVGASSDADTNDETASLTLTPTGGGYNGVKAAVVAFTIVDDD